MKRTSTFFDVQKDLASDALTEYLSGLSFTLNAFGHQHDDPTAVCSNRISGDFELIYMIGGKSLITITENEYECTAGDVVLIPPFTLHKIQTSPFAPHDNYWIHFDVNPFYRQAHFTNSLIANGMHRMTMQTKELLPLYHSLDQETQNKGPGNMVYCNLLLEQIIINLLRNGNTEASEAHVNLHLDKDAETKIITCSMGFIQNNIMEPITIASLCLHLHISESTLFRAFSNKLHGSPNYFILMCKIKKAEQLMKSTAYSFKEISQMLAFSSPYYFSTVFKRFYKMPPREYMNTMK